MTSAVSRWIAAAAGDDDVDDWDDDDDDDDDKRWSIYMKIQLHTMTSANVSPVDVDVSDYV